VKLHLDVKAMTSAEGRTPAAVIAEEGGRHLRHFHANDANLLGPGMGEVDQVPIGAALRAVGYNRWVSVETFAEGPGPEEIARRSLAELKRAYGEAANGA
jgi:sugar phosphate isomerase/epimerase